MTALVLLLGGMAAGCLGALAGVGGGILLVPLMSLLDVPFPIAVATSLVAVIATSSGSAVRFLEDDLCDVRLGIQLETATVTGAIVGGLAATRIPVGALRVTFGVLALYLAFWQLLIARRRPAADEAPAITGTYRRLPAGMLVSLIAGTVSALLGIGGGALKVPVMNMVMGVPFRVADRPKDRVPSLRVYEDDDVIARVPVTQVMSGLLTPARGAARTSSPSPPPPWQWQ